MKLCQEERYIVGCKVGIARSPLERVGGILSVEFEKEKNTHEFSYIG